MYVTFTLWIAVALCALAFAASGIWQKINIHAVKPALASGSPLRFGIAMLVFSAVCVLKGFGLTFW